MNNMESKVQSVLTDSTEKSSLPKKNFQLIFIVILIVILVVAAAIFLFKLKINNQESVLKSTLEMIPSAQITNENKKDLELAVAQWHLSYLDEQKDERGIYLDYARNANCNENENNCTNIPSNRAFLPVLWARYQYYLLTNDTTQLQILKDDIHQTQTEILDGYDAAGQKYVIQNNSFNCYLMRPMINDQNNIFTNLEKESLKNFCLASSYEWLDQEEITATGEADLNKQATTIPSSKVTQATLLKEINQKITLINNQQIANYDLNQDYVYQTFMSDVTAFLADKQTASVDKFFRGFTKGYYYFALDQLARYQLEPTNDNDYLALVLINDFLSLYFYSQQQIEPMFYVDVDNCFLQALIAQARVILPNGQEILDLSLTTYKPEWDVNLALNDDSNSSPTLACWLILLNQNQLDATQKLQFQNATFEYFGNNFISESVVKSSLITGLISQSLRE